VLSNTHVVFVLNKRH